MTHTKKFLSAISIIVVFCFFSCGQNGPATTNATDTTSKATAASAAKPASSQSCSSGTGDCFDIDGSLQSPINIVSNQNNIVPVTRDILGVTLETSPIPVVCFLDISHGENYSNITANLSAPSDKNSVVVNGATYKLIRFHFHRNCEHIIPGAPSETSVEMHLVFQNDAPAGNSVVLGLVLDTKGGTDNNLMGILWPRFGAIKAVTDTQKLGVSLNTIGSKPLADYFKTYWCYPGSLTTPCFREGVTWFVSREIGALSTKQLDEFSALAYNGNKIGPARPPQELRNRILLSK